MEELKDKIVALRIASRKACLCEMTGKKSYSTLSLKTKILYLLKDKPLPPFDIINTLSVFKTNLASITNQMVSESLIEKVKSEFDKREITYRITEHGKEYLDARLKIIEDAFKNIITTPDEYKEALENIDKVLRLLSFL